MVAVEISVSEQSELASLSRHLKRAPGVQVERVPGTPGPGEQGVWDLLQVAAGSGGALVIAIKMIPEFLKSRSKPTVSVTVKLSADGSKDIVINAASGEDAFRLLDKALNPARRRSAPDRQPPHR